MTEPYAPRGWPDCSQHVKYDLIAHTEWQSVCQQLDSIDLLSTADARTLELYCLTYSRFRAAKEQVRKHGDVLLLGKNKYPQVSPFYTAMNRYHAGGPDGIWAAEPYEAANDAFDFCEKPPVAARPRKISGPPHTLQDKPAVAHGQFVAEFPDVNRQSSSSAVSIVW